MEMPNEANVPGAAAVIRIHGGAGWYCTWHKKEIQPVLFEVNGEEIPCCEECLLEDTIENGMEIHEPTPSDPIDTAVGDHDVAEDAVWEHYT